MLMLAPEGLLRGDRGGTAAASSKVGAVDAAPALNVGSKPPPSSPTRQIVFESSLWIVWVGIFYRKYLREPNHGKHNHPLNPRREFISL